MIRRLCLSLSLLVFLPVSGSSPPGVPGEGSTVGVPARSFSRKVTLMGTEVYLEVQDPDRPRAFRRLEKMIEVLESEEHRLSTWRTDSHLSRVNAAPIGEPVSLDPEDCRLFEQLFWWQHETGGAFDPAVGRLEEVWGLPDHPSIPSSTSLDEALRRTGLAGIVLDSGTCRAVRHRDVGIDCGGFGKGEALDRLRETLVRESSPWLVSMGGQFMVWKPEGSPPWRIALAHPQRRDEPVLEVEMRRGSLAVSGTVRDQSVDGRRISHILNPVTGKPASFDGSVAVRHESGLVADIVSTALYVMGPEKGLAWAERRSLSACFLIPKGDGTVEIRATNAWRGMSVSSEVSGTDPPQG